MLKVLYACCPSLSLAISAQIALEMCVTVENRKKFIKKPLFCRSGSSKVIAFVANQKLVRDFLLVINSNLGPISHRF